MQLEIKLNTHLPYWTVFPQKKRIYGCFSSNIRWTVHYFDLVCWIFNAKLRIPRKTQFICHTIEHDMFSDCDCDHLAKEVIAHFSQTISGSSSQHVFPKLENVQLSQGWRSSNIETVDALHGDPNQKQNIETLIDRRGSSVRASSTLTTMRSWCISIFPSTAEEKRLSQQLWMMRT